MDHQVLKLLQQKETTIVRCHKNSWIYLTSTYYWWLLRPTITIRFDSKFQIIAKLFDSIQNKKNTIRTALLQSRRTESCLTSVNIDSISMTMADNTSAVGNDSRPWVVPQSIKRLSTITRERQIPPDSESGGIPHLFGTSLSTHIGSCLTGSSWQQQQQQLVHAHEAILTN